MLTNTIVFGSLVADFSKRERPTSHQFDIFILCSLWPCFNNTINVFQSLRLLIEPSIFASRSLMRQGSFALWPWSKIVASTVAINSSLKLASLKPCQPLMMSSPANVPKQCDIRQFSPQITLILHKIQMSSKCPKTMLFGAIFPLNYLNSTLDSAEQEVNSNEPRMVTWRAAIWHSFLILTSLWTTRFFIKSTDCICCAT